MKQMFKMAVLAGGASMLATSAAHAGAPVVAATGNPIAIVVVLFLILAIAAAGPSAGSGG